MDFVCAKHFKGEYFKIKTRTILNTAYPLKVWKLAADAIPAEVHDIILVFLD
jgi:hypothetical protein